MAPDFFLLKSSDLVLGISTLMVWELERAGDSVSCDALLWLSVLRVSYKGVLKSVLVPLQQSSKSHTRPGASWSWYSIRYTVAKLKACKARLFHRFKPPEVSISNGLDKLLKQALTTIQRWT